MTDAPRPPYCLSRQHPELAARSPATWIPTNSRKNSPEPAPPSPPEPAPRKHL